MTGSAWQRQEAGGPSADIGSQCLAGTLLRTLRAARNGDNSLSCSFVCLFVLFLKIPLAAGLETVIVEAGSYVGK